MWVDHLSFQVAHSLLPSFVRPLHSNSLVNIGPWCFSLQSLGELHWIDTTYNIQYSIQQWFLSARVVLCYFSKFLWCHATFAFRGHLRCPPSSPKNFPCQDSFRQADYLEIFESGEDLLAKTLRFSWLHWLGCPRSPFLRYHQKKTFVVIVMFVVTGVSRVPTLRQRWRPCRNNLAASAWGF